MGFDRLGQLLHQAAVLQNIERFLFTLPVFGAHHNKVLPGPSGDSEWLMPANALFYKLFKVISELVYSDCFHLAHQYLYGNALRVCCSRVNNLKRTDAGFGGAVVEGRYAAGQAEANIRILARDALHSSA
jgi:hypothetical protein